MTLLLTGKDGQLGWELHRHLEHDFEVIATGREDLNFLDTQHLHDMLRRLPELALIINTAAYTDVDGAEREPIIAEMMNTEAPAILAAEADRRGIPIIHFSTDYVFDGKKWTKPYTEQDRPSPLSIYGWSKLAGEQRVLELCEKALVFRVSGLYGTRCRNFFTTMLHSIQTGKTPRVVDDQIVSPNWTPMIAEAIHHVIDRLFQGQQKIWGIYHLSGIGSTTWYEFARLIFRKASELWNAKLVQPIPVDTKEYIAVAKRPAYSVLDPRKFERSFQYELLDWQSQFLCCIGTMDNSQST